MHTLHDVQGRIDAVVLSEPVFQAKSNFFGPMLQSSPSKWPCKPTLMRTARKIPRVF